MTTYTIEEGIPLPATRQGGPRNFGAKTPWTQTIDKLTPGQSVLTTDYGEFKTAHNFICRQSVREFRIRKVPGQGWRVWRVA